MNYQTAIRCGKCRKHPARCQCNGGEPSPVDPIVHTPGPWQSKIFEDGAYIIADGPVDELSSCIIASRNGHPDPPTGKANAALIAAAPELLAACQYLMQCVSEGTTQVFEQDAEYGQSPLTACELIQAAIKKATAAV